MVQIVGHRGGRNLWPENSLEGFRKLAALGVEAVEFDVHPTRDGDIAVIHDATLERTTLGEGRVADRTAAELAEIRLKDSDEHVSTLDAVLRVLAPTSFELHVEIKTDVGGEPYKGFEPRVVTSIEQHGLQDRTVYTSFRPEVLEAVRRLRPEARVLASVNEAWAERCGGVDAWLTRFSTIRGCLVAVEKGLLAKTQEFWQSRVGPERLGVWVPNERDDLAYWLKQPVRQLTTDRPDLAVELRGR